MAARSKARKRALDILFEAELRGLPTLQLLSERQSLGDVPVQPYAADLVRGVAANRERIDELISWNLVDWTLERMPAVDRNILRIGVYELLWANDVPDGVAISERIDELISWNLVDWTLERMPAVDRNILRIGVYELLWANDVPDGVAISEAVALAQDLSTDNSPSFVNGVLARIKAEKPTLSLEPEASAFAADDEDAGEDEEDDEDDGDDPYADDDGEPAGAPGPQSRP